MGPSSENIQNTLLSRFLPWLSLLPLLSPMAGKGPQGGGNPPTARRGGGPLTARHGAPWGDGGMRPTTLCGAPWSGSGPRDAAHDPPAASPTTVRAASLHEEREGHEGEDRRSHGVSCSRLTGGASTGRQGTEVVRLHRRRLWGRHGTELGRRGRVRRWLGPASSCVRRGGRRVHLRVVQLGVFWTSFAVV